MAQLAASAGHRLVSLDSALIAPDFELIESFLDVMVIVDSAEGSTEIAQLLDLLGLVVSGKGKELDVGKELEVRGKGDSFSGVH
jgi:hypothetical protein